MPKRRRSSALSVKSTRILERWGVESALSEGAKVAPVGEVYRLADGTAARLAFLRDQDERLCIGYAIEQDGEWVVREADLYSVRSLGYYRRRLKRMGEQELRVRHGRPLRNR